MIRFTALVVAAIVLAAPTTGCRRAASASRTSSVSTVPAAPAASAAHADAANQAADSGLAGDPQPQSARMPEDPVAGHQSDLEWRAHMAAEERDRQLGYDRRKLKQHQALVKLLRAAFTRYDRARTGAAVTKAQKAIASSMKALRARITVIDHWGVNSPLLGDYDSLLALLAELYPEARRAALRGDGSALAVLRTDVDRKLAKMAAWLRDAAASEDE